MRSPSGFKILIIEDQLIIAADICVQLSKLGCMVIGVNGSMADAFQTIKKIRPDIVLMDIGIKEQTDRISGVRTLMQSHHIPVIVLSADIGQAVFQQLAELRPYAFISKPFDAAGLQRGITSARRRLAAEATGAPVRRLFAHAGHSDDERRRPDSCAGPGEDVL